MVNTYQDRTPRKFHNVREPEKLEYMIENFLAKNPYYLKHELSRSFINPVQFQKPDKLVVDTKLKLKNDITLYNVYKKYVQFHCTVVQEMGPEKYLLKIHDCQVAAEGRKNNRITVDAGSVFVNNIRASRNVINASLFNIPTSVKVHFKQYEAVLAGLADEVSVDVFDRKTEKLEIVRRTRKSIYLKDTQNPHYYEKQEDDRVVDYSANTETEIPRVMTEYKRHKIVSEMIVPVIYTGHDGTPVPLGYIRLTSKKDPLDIQKIDELVSKGEEMVRKMRDSNTVIVSERQSIENICRDGIKLRITNPDLKKLLPEQTGITFDLVFRMTAPMTMFSEIIYTGTSGEDLIMGLKITGHSIGTGELTRFYSMIDTLS